MAETPVDIQADRVYKITNVKSGTVIDLSAQDGVNVSGWKDNGGNNQRWRAEKLDDGLWFLRSVANDRFLSLSIHNFQNGNHLRVDDVPFPWDIVRDQHNFTFYRIVVPDHQFNVDLDHGNVANGTTIHLWDQWDTPQQTWKFEEV